MELTKYKAALEKNPENIAAMRALAEQARSDGNYSELVDLLHGESALLPDGMEKADLLLQAGRVRQKKMSDPTGALEDYKSAWNACPGFTPAREACREVYIEAEDFESLVRSIEEESGENAESNPHKSAVLDLVCADLYRFKLKDVDRTVNACRSAIEKSPGLRPALVPLMELALENENWTEMEKLLDSMARSSKDKDDEIAWNFIRAHIVESRLNQPAEALGILEAILTTGDNDPESVPGPFVSAAHLARTELIEAGAVQGDPGESVLKIVELTGAEEEHSGSAWRAAHLCRLAERSETAGDAEGALSLFTEAHSLSPADPRPLRGMARLQRAAGKHEDSIETFSALLKLESSDSLASLWYLLRGAVMDLDLDKKEAATAEYRLSRGKSESVHSIEMEAATLEHFEKWDELASLIKSEIDKVQDDKLKAALWSELGEICRYGLKDPAGAAEALRQALTVAPTALGMVRRIAACYRETGDKLNWIRAVMGQEGLVEEKDYLVHLGLLAGRLWQNADREDEAFKSYSAVLAREANCVEALAALEDICYRQKSHKNLYGVQRRLLESMEQNDVAFKKAIITDNASLLLRPLGNPQAARQGFEEALALGLPSPDVLMELRWLAYAEGRWGDYFDIATREAEAGRRPPALLWRAALIAWARENRGDEAVELLDEVASRREADTALLSCIATLHYHRSDWVEWLQCMGELIPLIPEPSRSLYFWQMAGIHRWRLDSAPTAVECFERMAELDPQDAVAYEFMKSTHLISGEMERLSDVYTNLAELETEDFSKAARYFCRADLADVMETPSNAVSDLRRVLDIDPDNPAALRRIERLYGMLNNPGAQIEVIRREIDLRRDPAVKVLLHLRVGALWESQGRAAEAIAAYGQIPPIDPNELDALEALRRLHWQEEHWNELAEVLNIYSKAAPDIEKKVQLYHEKARVSEEKLNDIGGAIAGLEASLEVNPKHLETLTELERLYESTESWENELNAMSRQLDLLRDAKQLHRVHFKMGTIYEEKMNAPSAAVDSFVKAHDIEPQHLRTLDALERLYNNSGEAAKLAQILEEKAVLLPEERIRLYLWIGTLWAQPLDNPQKSIASYLRVTDLEPKNLEALNALEALYDKTEQWENLVKTLKTKAGAVETITESVELFCRAADLWVEKFNDDDKAILEYSKALEIDPRNVRALDSSRQILTRSEKWEDVVSLYGKQIEFTAEPQGKAQLLASSAAVIEEKIGDAARAASQYELALRSNPNCMEAVRPLAGIHFHAQNWEKAEPLYTKWLSTLSESSDPNMVAEVYYRHGRVLQGLSRDKDALEAYDRSVKFKPEYVDPLMARSDLFARRSEWAKALENESALMSMYEKAGNAAGMGNSLRRIGDFNESMGKEEEAIKSYNRSLEVAGDTEEVLDKLIELYSRKGLFNNAAGTLDRLIVMHQGKPEEAQSRLRKGLMLEEKIGDREGALKSYEAALAVDPNFRDAIYNRTRVLIDLRKWDEAEVAAAQLIEIEKEPERLADAHCLLGKIALGARKDLDGARASYEKALEIVPGHLGAMDSIGDILEQQEDWNGYIQTFEKFLKTLPETAQDKQLQIHLRLGQVWRDKQNNREKALVEFNNAVRIDPDNTDSHTSLAGLYIQDKNLYPQAVRENNILIKKDPFRIESYRDLAKIFEEQREVDKAFCAYSVLDMFDALEKWDRTNYEARTPHLPLHSQKIVENDLRDRTLMHPAARHPATNLLSNLGAALCKIFGTAVPTGAKAPSSHPAMKMATEIASNLGVESFNMYFDEGAEPAVAWAACDTPTIILNPKVFDGADERGQRFLVGRAVEGIANGLFAVWGTDEKEARKRLQVTVKLFRSDAGVDGMTDKEAASMAKQLKKEVPRKVRKGLDQFTDAHHNQEKTWPFATWLKSLEHSANRGGLVVSAHPGEAARALLTMEGLVIKEEEIGRPVMEKSDQLKELLRFAVSDQYFMARKRTGFSLY